MKNNERQSLRLFYALWPDDSVRAELMRLQALIRGRKTRYQNLHLTLAFLGQQSADLLPLLKSMLATLPSNAATLAVDRIGYFKQKKIVWAGMHDTPDALSALNEDLAGMLARNNITFNDQSAFRPHITLARDADSPEELPFDPFVWRCDHVALVESVTQPDGVIYRVLASHFLRRSETGDPHSSGMAGVEPNLITGADHI